MISNLYNFSGILPEVTSRKVKCNECGKLISIGFSISKYRATQTQTASRVLYYHKECLREEGVGKCQ